MVTMSTVIETEETGNVSEQWEVIETEAIGSAIVAIATVTMTGPRALAARTRLQRMTANDVIAKKSVSVPTAAA